MESGDLDNTDDDMTFSGDGGSGSGDCNDGDVVDCSPHNAQTPSRLRSVNDCYFTQLYKQTKSQVQDQPRQTEVRWSRMMSIPRPHL